MASAGSRDTMAIQFTLPRGEPVSVTESEAGLTLVVAGESVPFTAAADAATTTLTLAGAASAKAVWALLYTTFETSAAATLVVRAPTTGEDVYAAAGLAGTESFLLFDPGLGAFFATRSAFFQTSPADYGWTEPQGALLYSRFVPAVGKTFTLHVADINADLADFHAWMNDPRVDAFWQEAGDMDKHHAYLTGILADRHVVPAIGSFDGVKFLYVELYYAAEDRLAPFAAPGPHDMGFHLLVGNPALRGPHLVQAWMPSVTHYLFLTDLRTDHVFLEPRADNAKVIGYLERTSRFEKLKEFDFPHKRAALVRVTRQAFFAGF
ncbi:GNAT family N-acetyltransferase [Dipodascopsis tothii]|uniref:GNAT family N-acetyltransferase n=1 Tax=Dipodascopsis tothii TaxID=44089 RepID=UPI0034CF2B90